MPETVGAIILATLAEAGVAGPAGFALTSTTIAGVSAATVVGSAAIIGVSIGLQYALNNPSVPKPENGAQPLKQSIPPRIRGYWVNRLAGYYMLFIVSGADSMDVIAFHQGPIEEVLQVYFHDTLVTTTPVIAHGFATTVNTIGTDQFKNVLLQAFYGTETQNAGDMFSIINSGNTGGNWTADFHGKGIACLLMLCPGSADPSAYTLQYPQGLPIPSVVARCAPIFDPRDPTQSASDRSTWKASDNPVLQLIDYLTETDGGMGLDRDSILPPEVLDQWMVEASLCDEIVGGVKRYTSAGWYQFDNSPENVINKILAACDGWFSEAGDGTLTLTVGVYREPDDPPITSKHIRGFSVKAGTADEDSVNELIVSYTSPSNGYVSAQLDAVRNEEIISETGIVRSKPLDLSWVYISQQAERLAERAMLRLNPEMSGTLITTLYGLRYIGKRWLKLQLPEIEGLEDVVVEIQDKAKVDFISGKITFNWNLVDTEAFAADIVAFDALLREDGNAMLREDGSAYLREAA